MCFYYIDIVYWQKMLNLFKWLEKEAPEQLVFVQSPVLELKRCFALISSLMIISWDMSHEIIRSMICSNFINHEIRAKRVLNP